MKLKSNLFLAASLATVAVLSQVVFAGDVVKANNTDALNLATSWNTTLGPAPTSGDVAVWNSTVTAANTTTYGANLNWQGIRIVNPTGLVTIGNTADTTSLTLGASGIDMSAATGNLLIYGNLVAGAAQNWSVASGRTLQLQTLNTNRTLTGSGDISLVNSTGSGTATFDFRPGASGSTAFTAQSGFSGYSGNWTIGAGTLVKTLRNGINAWGSGTITLAGGTVGQRDNFNGVWTNNITLQSATTSIIDDFNNGGNRSLKLNGVISGSGNLTFQETNGSTTQTADICFTLGGANTMNGTVTVSSGSFLRVGSIGGDDSTNTGGAFSAGTSGNLGSASVTNNGTLSFTRTDAHTVTNTISGTGAVRVGSTGAMVSTAGQYLTLSGTKTYTGDTTIINGTLDLTAGKLYNGGFTNTAVVTVNAGGTLKVGSFGYDTANGLGKLSDYAARRVISGGTIEVTGATHASGNDFTVTASGGTFRYNPTNTADTLTLSGNTNDNIKLNGALGVDAVGNIAISEVIETASGTGSITKTGAGTLALSGANSYAGATNVSAGTLVASNASALGTTAGATTVISGAVLDVRANIGTEAIIVGGTGISNGGALITSSGTGTVGGAVTLTANTSVGGAGGLTISGAIGGGAFSLTKVGAGTTMLSTTNTYTGITSINDGTLELGSGGSIADSSRIHLAAGTNLVAAAGLTIGGTTAQTLSGTGTVQSNLIIGGNGIHAVGNSPGIQDVNGSLTYANDSIFSWDLATLTTAGRGTEFDGVNVTGDMTVASDAIFQVVLGTSGSEDDTFWSTDRIWAGVFDVAGTISGAFTNFQVVNSAFAPVTIANQPNGHFTFDNSTGSLNWSAVPEPTSALACLLLGAGLLRRKRSA